MTHTVKIVWKIFGRLAENVRPYEAIQQKGIDERSAADLMFNVRTGKSFLAEIGGGARLIPQPQVLAPTHIFHNAIRSTIVEQYPAVQGRRFPLDVNIDVGESAQPYVRVNLSIHGYGRILCLIVQTDEFEIGNVSTLSTIQNIDNQPGLAAVVRKVLGIAEVRSKDGRSRNGGLNSFPCVQIVASQDEPSLRSEFLSRLVTRHPGASAPIIQAQLNKNNVHQIDNSVVLCDRQGIVAYAPGSCAEAEIQGMKRRFRSAAAMLELAAATQRILQSNDPIPPRLFEEISTLINESDAILANSTSTYHIWQLIKNEFSLVASLRTKKIMEAKALKLTETKGTVLCMAAANIEFKTIKASFERRFGIGSKNKLGEGKDYDIVLSFLDQTTKMTWCLAPQLSQGVTAAAVDVQRVADEVKPDLVLMIGMCMSMPLAKLKTGTVIVPNSIALFDHQRYTDSVTQYRPRAAPVATGLHNIARVAATDHAAFEVIVDKGLACASIKIEDVSSGLVPFIATHLPDVVAFDMEGWGFFQGTARYESLWIKATADSGEAQSQVQEHRSSKQEVQAAATENAIAFAVNVVKHYCELKK